MCYTADMKAILNKKQLQTVMLLSAVIFILLCGVAYTVSTRTTTANTVPTNPDKPAYTMLRDARVSANANVDWETNVGGSSDESPVSVLTKNNEIYIFGNTSSSDYDFSGLEAGKTRGFGARLSATGRTLSFTVFDFTVAKAIPTLAGFAVAGNEGSAAGLYLLSDTLTVTGKTSMVPSQALTACGLYIFDNRYFLFAEARNEITDTTTLLLHIYTTGLTLEREKTFSHTYGLKLLDVMPYENGYILAADASFQDRGCLTVARFDTLTEPAYTDCNLGYKYTPTAFLPLGDGFAAACDNGGNCELLLLGHDLTKTDIRFLTKTPNANKKTIFFAGATYLYTGEKLHQLSDDGRSVGTLDYAPESILSFCANGAAAFAAGVQNGKMSVALLGKDKSKILPFQTVGCTNAVLYAGADHLLFAADTHGVTQDCPALFGGGDVWVGKIPLNA